MFIQALISKRPIKAFINTVLIRTTSINIMPSHLLGLRLRYYLLASKLKTIIAHNYMEQLAGRLANDLAYQTKQFVQACVRGNENLASSIPMGLFEKDLYDEQGSALIAWMAQHEMVATIEQVLKLGWNPNFPNKSQIYPFHYGAMKNPIVTRRLLQAGAHPFVQTAKGSTPAQVARNKGNVATLAVILPSLESISFKDIAAFEESYQTYKQCFPTRHQDDEELLVALELALQLGDTELMLAIKAKQASQKLIEQLIAKYPLAKEDIQARFGKHTRGQE